MCDYNIVINWLMMINGLDMSAYINNKMSFDATNAIAEIFNLIALEEKMAAVFGVPVETANDLLEMTSCELMKVATKYVKQVSDHGNIYKINKKLISSELIAIDASAKYSPMTIVFHEANKRSLHAVATSTLTALLSSIIEESEEGGSKIMKQFGFASQDILGLEKLKRVQIQYLAEQYVLAAGLYDLFNIDVEVLRTCISLVQKSVSEKLLIEAYINKEACNKTLKSLFGIRSNHIAEIRKRLNKRVPVGRSIDLKPENDEKIFKAWIKSMDIADVRERYLAVAEELNIGVSEVFRNMEMFETCKLKQRSAA